MKSNYAFIFARGVSKELKNKNIRLFNGKPLIFYSIDLAKKNKKIKKIFVSSDNSRILKIAKKYGAHTIIRPKSLSNDKSSEIRAWKHAIKYLQKNLIDNEIVIGMGAGSISKWMRDLKNII